MDTTQAITHISLCAGYGGIDIGLRGAIPNLRTVAFSEIEGFASANLVSKMEAGLLDCAPIWTDLKTFPWGAFSDRVDILSGGYPCQPFSAAGKRLGTDDPRHLWPFIADGIRILRPRFCFFENVEGHISLGLREVIGELESMGYSVSWGIFSAREVGAPHQRKRVFILAHSDRERGQLSDWWRESAEQVPVSNGQERRAWPSRPGQPQYGWEPPRVVGDSINNDGVNVSRNQCGKEEQSISSDSGGMGNAEHARLEGQWNNPTCEHWQDKGVQFGATDGDNSNSWQAESTMGRNAYGTPHWMDYAELSISCDNRTDELRLLGNGVVLATATLAFKTLLAELLTL